MDEDEQIAQKSATSVSFSNNPFSATTSNPFGRVPITSSKIILRQPMLNFSSTLNATTIAKCADGPFSLNLNKNNTASSQIVPPSNSSISSPSTLLSSNSSICGVCSTISTCKSVQQSRKFGISSCEACRKFIKKLTLNGTGSANVLQCVKNDGTDFIFCEVLVHILTFFLLLFSLLFSPLLQALVPYHRCTKAITLNRYVTHLRIVVMHVG